VSEAFPHKNLPILLGLIRQEAGNGELVLNQNDATRKFYFLQGELNHLRSDAAGEQFGNYLLRQGILDLSSLNELEAQDEHCRLGEKVIQMGMLTLEERDRHLQCHQEQIMLHALEHPILRWTWNADAPEHRGIQGLQFKLQHRQFIWRVFQEFGDLEQLLATLQREATWRWEGRGDLLESLSDLPLTSSTAFAVSFFTTDPIGFDTFRFLSNLGEEDAGRFIATLWALGALVMSGEGLPSLVSAPPVPAPSKPVSTLPLILPPPDSPFGPPKQRPPAAPIEMIPLELTGQLEFIDLEMDQRVDLELPVTPIPPRDMPPCGPRPQPRTQSLPLFEDDLPPCGPRPQPRLNTVPEDMPPCGPRPQPRLPSVPEDMPPCGPRPQPRLSSVSEDMPPCGPRPQAQPQPLPMPETVPMLEPPPQSLPQLSAHNPLNYIDLDPEHKGVPIPPTPQALLEARTRLDRARRQVMLGRTLEAVFTLEEAVQVMPDGDVAYEAWLMLGQLRMTNQAWSARAILALQNASRIRTREADPWTAMGEVYRRRGLESNAAACFQKAQELDPSRTFAPNRFPEASPNPTPPARKGLFGGRGGNP